MKPHCKHQLAVLFTLCLMVSVCHACFNLPPIPVVWPEEEIVCVDAYGSFGGASSHDQDEAGEYIFTYEWWLYDYQTYSYVNFYTGDYYSYMAAYCFDTPGRYAVDLYVEDDEATWSTSYDTCEVTVVRVTVDSPAYMGYKSSVEIDYMIEPEEVWDPDYANLNIYYGATLIRTIPLAASSGSHWTTWDGKKSDGTWASAGTYTVEVEAGSENPEHECYGYDAITVVEADVDVAGVADEVEESTGGFIALNDDDDDGDGVIDYDDGYNKDGIPGNADDENPSEDDLTDIGFDLLPSWLDAGSVTLSQTGGDKVALWYGMERLTLPMDWDLSDPQERADFEDFCLDSWASWVYIEGIAVSANLRDVEFKLSYASAGTVVHEDIVKLTVVQVDLDIGGVAESEEIHTGGFMALNDDDDDDNHTPDRDENGPVTNEDNLIEIILQKVRPEALTGNVTLKANAGGTYVRIWNGSTKGGTAITLDATYATPSALPKSLWVEGYNASGSVRDIELALEFTVGGKTFDDKVKMTVIDVQSIDVDSSGHDTYKIPSVLNASQVPDDHFVTVKGLSGDIVLRATIVPDTPETRNHITWGGWTMTQDPVDKLKATRGRPVWGEFPATVDVDLKDARDLTNWVVWSSWSTPTFSKSTQGVQVTTGDGTSGPGLKIIFTVSNLVFTISPNTLITRSNQDYPDLRGGHSGFGNVPGGTQTHVISGSALAGGAVNKWDESRRIRVKVNNPQLYPKSILDLVAGHLWNNQPVATDVPEDYPSNSVIGNDDTTPNDPEDNDPYSSPNIGQLTGSDAPSSPMRHSTGSDGDTFEVKYHFGEFARLELVNTWYRISDFVDWRAHYKVKRVNGQWTDDGSSAAADNSGW